LSRSIASITVTSVADLTGRSGSIVIPEDLDGATIAMRTGRHTVLQSHPELANAVSLDDLFDRLTPDSSAWRDEFLSRMRSLAYENALLYVVPGHARLAEATVSCLLDAHRRGEIALRFHEGESGNSRVPAAYLVAPAIAWTDVLALADIQAGHPFAGGGLPLHPGQLGIITNVTTPSLARLAAQVLLRRYPSSAWVHVMSLARADSSRTTSLAELSATVEELPAILIVESVDFESGSKAPDDLQQLVARLRAPDGCPWDREQTHRSLGRNLIEESYELLDAIERGDTELIQEELGDHLLQAYMHAQIAEEDGSFTLEDVVDTLLRKLVRRHPHVFSSASAEDSGQVLQTWDQIKRDEKRESERDESDGPFGRVPSHLPALMRAQTLLRRAQRAGYESGNGLGLIGEVPATEQHDLLAGLLGIINDANRRNLDLEALLREWTRSFEARASARLDNPNVN
jgi:tetrapyrrole methylase family protein / MazG family protein